MGAKSGRNKRGAKPGSKKQGAPKGGKGSASRATQRIGLVLFGAVFIALFVVFAVAQGIGAPSVPSGDIALVTNVPSEVGHISKDEYKRKLVQEVARAGLKKPPKPGSKKAKELQKNAIGELLNVAWITGTAEELGVKVTNKEIETELAKVKKESFKTEKAFQEFLKSSKLTTEDVHQLLELQLLQKKIEEKVKKETPELTEAELQDYYEAEKATQFTKKPTRDVRVIVNEDKKEVEAAKKALEADNSAASWKKVTKKYSPTTASQGGLQKEISEEFLTGPLKKDIFKSQTGELIGPVKQEKTYLLLEVVKLHPEKTQSLKEVEATIKSTLGQERQQKFFSEWVTAFQEKWTSRTHCAPGYVIEQCANYKGSAHPSTAAASCYEANPKVPPAECPAPVAQNQPAAPGSVTVAKPEGERLVQRPRPEEATKAGKEGKAGAAGAAKAGKGSSAEAEAATRAAEEAAAKAAEEAAKKAGGKEGK